MLRQTVRMLGPHIDTRAPGKGYIVAAPSVVNGSTYFWEVSPEPSCRADLPLALQEALSHDQHPRRKPAARPPGQTSVLPEGRRNSGLTRWAGQLIARRVDPELVGNAIWALNRMFCRPPLAPAEVAAIIKSVGRCESRKRVSRHV